MKKNLFSLLILCGSLMSAQTYSNGNLSTGATTGNGTSAPSGYTWSELQNGNTTLGTSGFKGGASDFRLADNFTVPALEKWAISSVEVFGYQTGATVFPVDQLNVRIWDASPTAGAVVFGDVTTNVIDAAGSVDALIYRTGTTPGTTRKVWKFKGNVSKELMPGTYWLDYQVHAINDGSVFFPPVTIVGSNGPADANTLQLTTAGWVPVVDTGTSAAQAMPFIINYVATALGTTETRQFDSRVVVYPNPAVDSFKLILPSESKNAKTEVSIFDQSGKKVKSFPLADSYNVSDLPKGMYIIKVNDGQNLKATKLIKK